MTPNVREDDFGYGDKVTRDLPEDADRAINRHGDLFITVTEDNIDDFPDGLNLGPGKRVLFEDGEEVPLELVEGDVYTSFYDTFEIRNEENEVIRSAE
ncbi:hypothetical protein [Haloterrigena salinisoli]|uniref:hypothetical protein n=1 Tax=Haloterrigena salinisoli TaxID=3132747 RepID=UPI0030D5150A